MMSCNSIVRKLLWILLLSMFVACFPPADQYPNPKVKEAPSVGHPFVAGTVLSLDDYGYEQVEFFFSGKANSYVNTIPFQSDGKWVVTSAESASYKTRMLIYRPIDPADFNGTVLVEWLNVTAGIDTATDWLILHTEILRRGYAWVGISAQYIGVEGGDPPLPTPLGTSLPLKTIRPIRYRSLSHPGDSFSYDIFAQAGKAIRQPSGIAPLGELQINKMIAMGESQSAMRLMTFVNAFGKKADFFDGYFIHSRMGGTEEFFGGASAPLSEAPQADITTLPVVKVRDDLGKPVLSFQTETDVLVTAAYESRQDDSSTFRLWEVTGTAHADMYLMGIGMADAGDVSSAEIVVANRPNIVMAECPDAVNSAPQHHFAAKAALNALNRWLVDGIAPPTVARLALNAGGDGFECDANGNALGGVRSPYVDAPIARFSGTNSSENDGSSICFLMGETEMLDDAVLRSLYPNHCAYVTAVTEAAQDAVAKGHLLQEDAALIISAAAAGDIPPQ